MNEVAWCARSICWDCGRLVDHQPHGGPMKRHACRLRWLSRIRWKAHLAGWHEGYRFAVENPNDPLVLADADDYGRGWAGHMRVGAIPIVVDTPDENSGSTS
ncbi:MAG TPA: hypothetical protein VGL02_27390 [Streptomyces sp.]